MEPLEERNDQQLRELAAESNIAPFLADGATWEKKTRAQPLRGFTDDGETVPLSRRKTARQKVNFFGTNARADSQLGSCAPLLVVIANPLATDPSSR